MSTPLLHPRVPFRSRRCTPTRPWHPDDGDTFFHPDAVEVGEQRDNYPCGDLVDCKCPHCGREFTIELPQ